MNNFLKHFSLFILLGITTISCKEDVLPKPTANLRLEYPKQEYSLYDKGCAYNFMVNKNAKIEIDKNCSYKIEYKKMKATVYLTYIPVNGNIEATLRDAQKLTYKHVIKAEEILEQPFLNPSKKAYGMFYQVGGNAATNAQFYVTDSIKHFVAGSMYFYAKPNYDSLLPAAEYVKKDIKKLMESIEWK